MNSHPESTSILQPVNLWLESWLQPCLFCTPCPQTARPKPSTDLLELATAYGSLVAVHPLFPEYTGFLVFWTCFSLPLFFFFFRFLEDTRWIPGHCVREQEWARPEISLNRKPPDWYSLPGPVRIPKKTTAQPGKSLRMAWADLEF